MFSVVLKISITAKKLYIEKKTNFMFVGGEGRWPRRLDGKTRREQNSVGGTGWMSVAS